jgi:hypothetical protein
VKCREVKETISLGVCDYFIRCVLTILLGVLYYGCFKFICFVICVCVCFCNQLCTHLHLPIPEAERSKAWVCSRSPAGIAGSNPAGGIDVCLL